MNRRVLFVSNGVGEDLIAAGIAGIVQDAGAEATAYPLVGLGAYPTHTSLLDPRRELPSGGFSFRAGSRGLGADLAAGIAGLWFAQRRTLTRQRDRFDLVVAVGDVYCLWMAAIASPRPVMVATAESVRSSRFGLSARWVLRRHARHIFARDPDTAEALTAMGLPAEAPGNVMMDLLKRTGETFGLPQETPVVTLLPGSRRDAEENASLMARAADVIARETADVRFLLAVAPTVSAASIMERCGTLDAAATASDGGLQIGRARVQLTTAFADAVARAWVVLGMAGTANEQAAGLGRPVVAFPGHGAQFGPQFLRTQHQLLGDALVPARDWREAAGVVVRLLRDSGERERRGAAGRERMGPPGGTRRIADALLGILAGLNSRRLMR